MVASGKDQFFWTAQFSKFAPDQKLPDLSKLRQQWWFNPLSKSSMRLSKVGFNFVTTRVDIQCYSHSLEGKIRPKTLLQLEKFLEYPYYIENINTLKVFDQTTSVTLTLYNNNLQSYLDNVQKFM